MDLAAALERRLAAGRLPSRRLSESGCAPRALVAGGDRTTRVSRGGDGRTAPDGRVVSEPPGADLAVPTLATDAARGEPFDVPPRAVDDDASTARRTTRTDGPTGVRRRTGVAARVTSRLTPRGARSRARLEGHAAQGRDRRRTRWRRAGAAWRRTW